MAVDMVVRLVVLTAGDGQLEVLLLQGADGATRRWMLPDAALAAEQDLEQCALDVLRNQAGFEDVYLEQLYTFGDAARAPGRRELAVCYLAVVPPQRRGAVRRTVRWFDIGLLPKALPDQHCIAELARQRVAAKLDYSTIAFHFMPPEFTLSELQAVYEVILGDALDKRNFRKRILALDCIADTGRFKRAGSHRPARLYAYTSPGEIQYLK